MAGQVRSIAWQLGVVAQVGDSYRTMSIILVTGPSGVGKTTLGRHADQIVDCQFLDLDRLVAARMECSSSKLLLSIGNDAFFGVCHDEIELLCNEHPNGLYVVAVGAGTLQSYHALDWLRQYPTIAILDSPEEVYGRGGARNYYRSFEGFQRVEYSSYRDQIYETADHKLVVVGLSLQRAKDEFLERIKLIHILAKRERYELY